MNATGRRVWVIEPDGMHTAGTLVSAGSIWPGQCRVRRDGQHGSELWGRRNVVDHASGERLG